MTIPISIVVSKAAEPDALAAWDRLVNTAGTDVSQLTSWAHVRREAGYAPLHVFAFRQKRLVAGAQVLYRTLPVIGSTAYVPFGPVFSEVEPDREVIQTSLAAALGQLGRHEFTALRVQPCLSGDDVSRELLRHGFRRTTDAAVGRGSLRVSLSCPEQDLRRQLGKTVRSWTRRWADNGVTVRLGGYGDLVLLHRLMQDTARHQGFKPTSFDTLKGIYEELAPRGNAFLFVGEVYGTPVAADLLTACGGVLKGHFTGFDRSDEARKLRVPGAIRWEVMQWGRLHGYRSFDFGGLHAVTLAGMLRGVRDDATWPSVDRAKLHFGGTPYAYPPAVEFIKPLVLKRSYDVLRRTRASHKLLRLVHARITRSDNAGRYTEELRGHFTIQ